MNSRRWKTSEIVKGRHQGMNRLVTVVDAAHHNDEDVSRWTTITTEAFDGVTQQRSDVTGMLLAVVFYGA